MEMQQVRYILALCKERNFTRAARSCGVSQPSLSNAIRKLEQELGGQLFHRSHATCDLSALGQEVRPHLARLDQCARDARDQAARFLAAPQTSRAALHQARPIDSPEQHDKAIPSRAPAPGAFATQGAVMRAHHIVAVVAVILLGLTVKLFFFAASTAVANPHVIDSTGVDVSRLQRNARDLPVQKVDDMSFVFSGNE
jgi:hypothetical protein